MSEQPSRQIIDFSWWTIAKVFLVILGIYFLYSVKEIIVILFLVFIFVAAINPIVTKMQRRVPRVVAVLLVYLGLFLIAVGVSTLVFQPLISQLNSLAITIPEKINDLVPILGFKVGNGRDLFIQVASGLQRFSGTISSLSGDIVNTTFGIFGGIFTAFTILVLSFYLLLEEEAAKHFLDNVLPPNQRDRIFRLIIKVSDKMGAWVRGQLLLMLIIGLLDLVVLLVLGVQAPLALAIWGGLMEVIPYLGPILGALPAVIVALVAGTPLQALIVAILMIVVVQQLEGQFLVPKVMQKTVGLSPVIVIIALLIGGKLFGIYGAVLAIPIAAIVAVLVEEWSNVHKTLSGA